MCKNIHTVKSLLVAAATIEFRAFLLRPQIKGGYYLRAATIRYILKNGKKMAKKALNEPFYPIFSVFLVEVRLLFEGGYY